MTGKLIGIVGYKGAGKTSITAAAIGRWNSPPNCVQRNFSEPIVNMLAAMGIPRDTLDDKTRWNDPQPELCGHSIRYAAQTLGTEWGRDHIGQDVWTNIELRHASNLRATGKHIIIDNVRFPSEADAIELAGGTCIALIRPDLTPDLSHASEQYIEELQERCAAHVLNTGEFLQGVEKMRRVLVDVISA